MATEERFENQKLIYGKNSIQFTEQKIFNALYLQKVLEANREKTAPIETHDLTILLKEPALERMRDFFTAEHNLTTDKGHILEPQDLQSLVDKFYSTSTIIFGIDEKRKNNDLAVRFDNLWFARLFIEFYTKGRLFKSGSIKSKPEKPRLYYGFVYEPEKAFGKIPGNKSISGPNLRRKAKQFLATNSLQEDLLRICVNHLFSEFYFLTVDEKDKKSLLHYNYKKEKNNHFWVRYPATRYIDIKRILAEEKGRSVLLVVDSGLEKYIGKGISSISAGRNLSKVIFSQYKVN